jgi:hypothetical protein
MVHLLSVSLNLVWKSCQPISGLLRLSNHCECKKSGAKPHKTAYQAQSAPVKPISFEIAREQAFTDFAKDLILPEVIRMAAPDMDTAATGFAR